MSEALIDEHPITGSRTETMESRKRTVRRTAPNRVDQSVDVLSLAPLPHIVALIESGGQLTLGALPPIKCVAVANDDHICSAAAT